MIERLESRELFTVLPSGFSQSVVASGFGAPTAMDVLPDGQLLVTVKTGAVRLVVHGVMQSTPVVSLDVDSTGERGLIGITHDPNFDSNHFIYLYHTVPATSATAAFNEISRYTMDGRTASAGSRVDILALNHLSSGDQSQRRRDSFWRRWDALRRGGRKRADGEFPDTLGNLLGKVLRIDVSQHRTRRSDQRCRQAGAGRQPVCLSDGGNKRRNLMHWDFAIRLPSQCSRLLERFSWTTSALKRGKKLTVCYREETTAGAGQKALQSNGTPSNLGPGIYADPILAYNHHGGPAGGGNAIIGGTFYNLTRGSDRRISSGVRWEIHLRRLRPRLHPRVRSKASGALELP